MNARRQALARIAAATLLAACGNPHAAGLGERLGALLGASRGRLSVVLVDTTGSIAAQDWQLYERALQALLANAGPGDRVVLAAVSDQPGSRFIAQADHGFKSTGNGMNDEVRARRTRAALQAEFAALRSANAQPARGTLLLDAVGAAAEGFAQARAQGQELRLLVLSDMVEESPTVNLARQAVTPALAERVIQAQRRRGLLPDLAGVHVQVVGASGRDAAQMADIRSFWQAYFAAAGAALDGYGRSVGHPSQRAASRANAT